MTTMSPLRDEEFWRVINIEGGEVGGNQLLERLAALDWSRDTTDTADVVRTAQFIDDVQVPVAPELLFPAQHELLVLLSAHCFAFLPEAAASTSVAPAWELPEGASPACPADPRVSPSQRRAATRPAPVPARRSVRQTMARTTTDPRSSRAASQPPVRSPRCRSARPE